MSKVLVDRELLLQLFRCWDCGLEVDNELAQLRIAAAQPAEAEGVEVVAWQQRYICPDEGPSCWQSADERTLEILRRRDDYELRQLVPLTALSAVTAERDRLQQFEATYNEWLDKTEWVQKTAKAHELGKHRADVLKDRIDQLRAEVERLTGIIGNQVVRKFVGQNDQREIDELVALGIEQDKCEIEKLRTEIERIRAQRDKMVQILRDLDPGCKWRFMRPRIDQALQEVGGGN